MRGDAGIIDHLNTILANELTAINQYFLRARILKNWGLLRLAKKIHDESIEEMRHADAMIERILFLEGMPNMAEPYRLKVGTTLPEMFEADLAVETGNRNDLKKAISASEAAFDYESRAIFGQILHDTEEHIDWLETQLELIGRIGLQAYQQEQMNEA